MTNVVLLIGNISLNIALILYLILYIPQIIHNRQTENLANLSCMTHFLLYLSYSFDLFYGIANHFPWQYKMVSFVSLFLILVQHLQLTRFLFHQKSFVRMNINIFCLILTLISNYVFFIVWQGELSNQTSLLFGGISRFCGLLYCLPQIKKNWAAKTANAISIQFIYLNLILGILDMISAWCLDWGWPNKIASPLTILLMVILLTQIKQYSPSSLFSPLKKNKFTAIENQNKGYLYDL